MGSGYAPRGGPLPGTQCLCPSFVNSLCRWYTTNQAIQPCLKCGDFFAILFLVLCNHLCVGIRDLRCFISRPYIYQGGVSVFYLIVTDVVCCETYFLFCKSGFEKTHLPYRPFRSSLLFSFFLKLSPRGFKPGFPLFQRHFLYIVPLFLKFSH